MENNDLIAPPKMDFPFASVIVPVYNDAAIIGECIESLLTQNYPKNRYEIIIVNNNSTDDTPKIIKKYPVKYICENEVQSSYAARNTGARIAKGEALAFFDADQVAAKNWLSNLLKGWDSKEYGVFAAKEVNIVPKSPLIEKYLTVPEEKVGADHDSLKKLQGGQGAYRREVFEKLMGFDESFAAAGDHDLVFRMQKELNLKVMFNKDAVYYHKQQRNDLTSLLKRESRIGFGNCMLAYRHVEVRKPLFLWSIKLIKRTILGVEALLFGLVKPLNGKSRREHVLLILLDIAVRWAYFYGMLCYHLGAEKCGDLPPGTKSGRCELENSYNSLTK